MTPPARAVGQPGVVTCGYRVTAQGAGPLQHPHHSGAHPQPMFLFTGHFAGVASHAILFSDHP